MDNKNKKKKWGIIALIVVIIAIVGIALGGDSNDDTPKKSYGTQEKEKEATPVINEPFMLKKFEVTVSDEVKIVKPYTYLTDKYIKIPITIKNTSDQNETFYSAYLTVYDPTGIETSKHYGGDDNIVSLDSMRSGASVTKYLYAEYKGAGTYEIDFGSWFTSTKTLEIEVN